MDDGDGDGGILHIFVFPWLAMGHIIPFFNLSKFLARKGHRVSFVSTPRNLHRLPQVPQNLAHLLNLISFPLSPVPNLPADAESSTDIPIHKQQLLKVAFDLLKSPLTEFLETEKPDWIIYDYASHWLPSLAGEIGISRVFFSLFTAAVLSFIGPPSELIHGRDGRSTAEDFTVVPKWIPFESDIVYRFHEVTKNVNGSSANDSGTSDSIRFGVAAGESDVVAVRSSVEFEPEWFDLLHRLYEKPIVPIGFLPPSMEDDDDDDEEEKEIDEKWLKIERWLDEQRVNSVIYVALGSEATLSGEELNSLALGLEESGLPFFWVLRNAPESTRNVLGMLPDGFEERVRGRGVVFVGWAPQVKILSHESVGGFLTHCGWNSVIEGLGFGRVLILFPVLNDQGPNARLLQGKNLGVEIPRNEKDGSFKSASVCESVRLAMVGDLGELVRAKTKEMRRLFGDRNKNEQWMNEFVHYLEMKRAKHLHPARPFGS